MESDARGYLFSPRILRLKRSPGKAGPGEVFLKGSEGRAVSQGNTFGNEGTMGHHRTREQLLFGGEGMEAKIICGQLLNNFQTYQRKPKRPNLNPGENTSINIHFLLIFIIFFQLFLPSSCSGRTVYIWGVTICVIFGSVAQVVNRTQSRSC